VQVARSQVGLRQWTSPGGTSPAWPTPGPGRWCGASNWAEDRVFFFDEERQLRSLPAAWTDVVGVDPFVVVAARDLLRRRLNAMPLQVELESESWPHRLLLKSGMLQSHCESKARGRWRFIAAYQESPTSRANRASSARVRSPSFC